MIMLNTRLTCEEETEHACQEQAMVVMCCWRCKLARGHADASNGLVAGDLPGFHVGYPHGGSSCGSRLCKEALRVRQAEDKPTWASVDDAKILGF